MSHHPILPPPDAEAAPPEVVRRHLDDLLASPYFRNSKRSQALLRYVVDAYLEGAFERVKERTIGHEVFHRGADYDTNQDSIVRTTAAEVRKRLAQYYQDAGQTAEISLHLPQGSYWPEFHHPAAAPATAVAVATAPVGPRSRGWLWAVCALGVVIAAALLYAVPALRRSDLDRFWMPLFDDPTEAVICIEQPLRIYRFAGPRADELNQAMVGAPNSAPPAKPEGTVSLSEVLPTGEQYFTYGDLMASVRLGELMARRHKAFQVLGDRLTSYSDLRGRPAVLLGQFNNKWTTGLTSGLRYYLDKNNVERSYLVRDRQNGGKPIASLQRLGRSEDYAIISRILDVATEKTVIAVSATTFFGTYAAGDFLTHESYMQEAFRGAPPQWWRKNLQVVIRAPLIDGTSGPPKTVALHVW
jgi:hypothetical protein